METRLEVTVKRIKKTWKVMERTLGQDDLGRCDCRQFFRSLTKEERKESDPVVKSTDHLL
jgi:hypothetical protein